MKQLKFKTNINCNGCIAKVTPALNQIKGILKWEVDTGHPHKILSVDTEDTNNTEIIDVLNTLGYKAEIIND